ncbi:hypothetical protein [Rubritalea tangerina]|uniref:hypothetical protein n=1 Tax=Rubritalea tangerina TaxID=430798 RepID=UPI00361B87FC
MRSPDAFCPKAAIFSPTARAISPPTFASISSNTINGVHPDSLKRSSPPTSLARSHHWTLPGRSGFNGSPGFGPN